MTEKQFLSTLNRRLWWDVPGAERKAAVSSYQKFFTENSCRDEAELVAECGDVNLIAGEILAGYSQITLPFLRFLLVGWLWFIAYKMIEYIPTLHYSITDKAWLWQIFYIVWIPAITLCLIIGKRIQMKSFPAKKALLLSLLSILLLFTGMALFLHFFTDIPLQAILRIEDGDAIVSMPFWGEIPFSGQRGSFRFAVFLFNLMDIVALLTVLLACFVTMMAMKVNIKFSALLPLCGGLLFYLQRYYHLFYRIDITSPNMEEYYLPEILPAYLSIPVTVIVTILFCFGLRFLKRRCAK